METENFVGLDVERECYNTLHASRIAATVLLLLCAGWTMMQYLSVQQASGVFENMVTGGIQAMPALTVLVIDHGMEAAALSCLAAFGAVLFTWVAGRTVARVILATTAGSVICLLTGLVMQLAVRQPLLTIITQFNG